MPYVTKCISLPSRFGDENDWRLYGNNDYIVTLARCHWVRLWVIWREIEPTQPASDLWTRWAQLNRLPYFVDLDNIILDANRKNVAVMLSMSQYMPSWANGATGAEPGTGKEASRRLPLSVSTDSPWSGFLAYLYCRYWSNAAHVGVVNPTGPTQAKPLGNPKGAKVSGLGIVNEPNYEAWQDYDIGCTCAAMIQTMDAVGAFWDVSSGQTGAMGPVMFAPDLADAADSFADDGTRRRSDYLTVTKNTLALLENWRPRKSWAWSHHCYRDVDDGVNTRAEKVRQALAASPAWPNDYVYTTEGGWSMGNNYANNYIQADKVRTHWNLSRSASFRMGTQHTIRGQQGTYEMVYHPTPEFPMELKLQLWYDFQPLAARRP